MSENFFYHPDTILRTDCLDLFTRSPFLSVHFHWTTTCLSAASWTALGILRPTIS